MSGYIERDTTALFDPTTGQLVGFKDIKGREAFVPAADAVTGQMPAEGQATVRKANAVNAGAQLARAAARYPAKYRAGLSFLNIVGDSWAAGNGASSGAKSYAGLLATEYASKFAVSNYGYAGRPISGYQQAPRTSGTNLSNAALIQTKTDDVTFGIFGLNDLNGIDVNSGNTGCGPIPDKFPNLITRTQAVATWFMAPESSRVRMHTLNNSGPNPAVTFSGTWNHGGFQNNPNFSYGNGTTGDFCQFVTPPGDLLVIRHATVNGGTGQMRITVDGVDYLDRGLASQFENFFVIDSTIIKLPTGGAHTVKLTSVNSALIMIDSVDCLDTTADFSATLLYSPPTHLTVAGWAATTASPNSSSLAGATGASVWLYDNGGSDRFGAAIDAAMAGLYDFGFNVARLPIREGFNPQWATSAGDPLHPNDQGHAHNFNRARWGINKLLTGGA